LSLQQGEPYVDSLNKIKMKKSEMGIDIFFLAPLIDNSIVEFLIPRNRLSTQAKVLVITRALCNKPLIKR
jgi:hypothetical protein